MGAGLQQRPSEFHGFSILGICSSLPRLIKGFPADQAS